MHLHGLAPHLVADCLTDLARETFAATGQDSVPANYRDFLLRTFGRTLCDLFFFPYNEKMWKRPLERLAPAGFIWNIAHPDFRQVVRGAIAETEYAAYNAAGWYPCPPAGTSLRGMEVLSAALAREVPDLRLRHAVESLDLERRLARVRRPDGAVAELEFTRNCVATIPLPYLLDCCVQTPKDLRQAAQALACNRVVMAAFGLRGARPHDRGHWRYFTDADIVFTRVIHMYEFDSLSAPEDGWGLMAEITMPAESPLHDPHELLPRVEHDLRRAGCIRGADTVVERASWVAEPAYVVFTRESQQVVRDAIEFLAAHGVVTIGRFGRWEYSSMSQVLRDGFAWARAARMARAAGRAAC
jgi:protoporphyrinogen oxidase